MILDNDLLNLNREMKAKSDIYSKQDEIIDLNGHHEQYKDTESRGFLLDCMTVKRRHGETQ